VHDDLSERSRACDERHQAWAPAGAPLGEHHQQHSSVEPDRMVYSARRSGLSGPARVGVAECLRTNVVFTRGRYHFLTGSMDWAPQTFKDAYVATDLGRA